MKNKNINYKCKQEICTVMNYSSKYKTLFHSADLSVGQDRHGSFIFFSSSFFLQFECQIFNPVEGRGHVRKGNNFPFLVLHQSDDTVDGPLLAQHKVASESPRAVGRIVWGILVYDIGPWSGVVIGEACDVVRGGEGLPVLHNNPVQELVIWAVPSPARRRSLLFMQGFKECSSLAAVKLRGHV